MANTESTEMKNLPVIQYFGGPNIISESKQNSATASISLSQPAPIGGLAIDYIFTSQDTVVVGEDLTVDLDASQNLDSLTFTPDGTGGVVTVTEGATNATVVVLPLVDNDTDEEILAVKLTQAEGYDIDSNVNSFTVKIVDDLPVIKFSGSPQVISESKQTPHIVTINLSQPSPDEGLAIDYLLTPENNAIAGEDFTIDLDASKNILNVSVSDDRKTGVVTVAPGATTATVVTIPVIDNDSDEEVIGVKLTGAEGYEIDPDENSFLVKIVDDLPQPKSKFVSGTPGDDILIAGVDIDGVGNIIFAGAGDDEIDLAFGGGKNRVDAGSGDDVFYLGKNDRALGGAGDDKFFASGGNNILFGGEGADQFWIVNGEIPEAANTIVGFEIGTDVIGILGSAGLGIDASTLELNVVDSNTEIGFGGQTLVMLNGVTGLDVNSNIVFA